MRADSSLTGSVPSGWTLTTLGAAAEQGGGGIQTGPFGSQLHASDYVAEGIPSIMPQNIGDNRLVLDAIARIDQRDAQRLSRYRVMAGDIVYSRRGDVEKRAIVREPEDGWLCGTGCLRVRLGSAGPDPAFVSYYLGDPRVRRWVVDHAVGATMPNLNTAILSALPLLVPPPREQRAIAGVLGALDDKIELNRLMNKTLDAVAGAMYREWFDRESAGSAPPGWSSSPIGEVVSVRGGSTPRTSEPAFWNGDHAFATPKDLARLSSPVLLETERRITAEGVKQTNSGLLPAGTVLLSSRAPIGYLAISEIPVSINQGFIAMVCDGELPNLYVLRWAQSNLDVIVGAANGTTFLEISKRNFRPLPVSIPPRELLDRFMVVAGDLHARVVTNLHESRTLAELRDTLLPKLISGELRVRDAEAAGESAGA